MGTAVENKSYQKDDKETPDKVEDIDLMIRRKHLETITENQNSPYSTQASQCTARRMSAQSIFSDTARRGSSLFTAPLLELFHENELEEKFVEARENTEIEQTSCGSNPEYARCFRGKNDNLLQAEFDAETGVAPEVNKISTINEVHRSSTIQSNRTTDILGESESTTPELQRRSPILQPPLLNNVKTEVKSDSSDGEGNPVFV